MGSGGPTRLQLRLRVSYLLRWVSFRTTQPFFFHSLIVFPPILLLCSSAKFCPKKLTNWIQFYRDWNKKYTNNFLSVDIKVIRVFQLTWCFASFCSRNIGWNNQPNHNRNQGSRQHNAPIIQQSYHPQSQSRPRDPNELNLKRHDHFRRWRSFYAQFIE